MKNKKEKKNILGRLQRTPLWKKEEFSEIEYEPTTVKDLMTEYNSKRSYDRNEKYFRINNRFSLFFSSF